MISDVREDRLLIPHTKFHLLSRMIRDHEWYLRVSVVIAWSLWLVKLTVHSQTPIKVLCFTLCLKCSPAPEMYEQDSCSLGGCLLSLPQTPAVWGGAHCSQPRAASFASACYFRHWGHFLDAAIITTSINDALQLYLGARGWEQSNASSTSLNFSTVDFNKDIFCSTL